MIKRTLRTLAAVAIAAAATLTAAGTAEARDTPSGNFCYQAHIQNVGWQDWRCDGEWAGTTGRALAVEAVRYHFNVGNNPARLCFRAHRSNYGWDANYVCLDSAHSTIQIGTEGMNTPIEAIRYFEDGWSPVSSFHADAHVRNIGWQGGPTYIGGNFGTEQIGTTGQALPIEALWFQWY
ncbi:hypothetical protein ABT095_33505 [Kitasatospora sp. NPDC002227]|uniref:hypothetical protein n=1 Tax=Kitasatospora sp. NPDC002227 TaxID=3154773 RepID=UPI0033316ABA